MWFVVGLGNPGPEYADHRHNVGFQVVDRWPMVPGSIASKRAKALTWEGRLEGRRVVLVKPTHLHERQRPGGRLALFVLQGRPERLIAVHDELDLPFGSLRVKWGGGDNGHNGLKSMRKSLGTGDFYRARVGIGRPPGRMDAAAFVLRDFSSTERREVSEVVERVADAVTSLMQQGLETTQSQFND